MLYRTLIVLTVLMFGVLALQSYFVGTTQANCPGYATPGMCVADKSCAWISVTDPQICWSKQK